MKKIDNLNNKNHLESTQKKIIDELYTKRKNNSINTDPNGSWTGVAENPMEKPVQDVDDL